MGSNIESTVFINNTNRKNRKLTDAEGIRLKSEPACYIIENQETKNLYVGSTKNISRRISKHLTSLKSNSHSNKNLQNDFNNTDDKDKIIVYISPYKTLDEARNEEQLILDEGHGSDIMLNISNNARAPNSGYDRTDIITKTKITINTSEHKEKVSLESKQRWQNEEFRKKSIKSMGENIEVDGVSYGSVREASRETGFCIATIRNNLIDGKASSKTFKLTKRKVSVRGIIYNTVTEAANALNVATNTMTWRCQNQDDIWKDHFYLD
jgi:group I intron endonuclease